MLTLTRRHFLKSSTLLTANLALTGVHGCIPKPGWAPKTIFCRPVAGLKSRQ